MQRIWIYGFVALGAVVLFWALLLESPPPVEVPSAPVPIVSPREEAGRRPAPAPHRLTVPESAISAEHAPDGVVLAPGAADLTHSLNTPDSSAENDLEVISTLLEIFRRANGGANPAGGLNEEFVEQMRGKNSRHFGVFPADTPGINSAGQLVDRWGTPYFFHPVSRTILEVRSAGPDRRFWTADDIEAEPARNALEVNK